MPSGLLPEILAPGLDVIFVGAAPSVAAAASGHYYAGSRNRFWTLLHQAGFTPRLLAAEEDREVLRYGIGLTAVFPHRISTSNDLLPTPTADERNTLRQRLLRLSPRFIFYNGADVYRMIHGEPPPRWGLQRDLHGTSAQFVAHSSSGRADRWGADRLFLYRELKLLVEAAQHLR